MQTAILRLGLLAGALGLASGAAHATNISGTVSSTLTINSDSKLVGDVTCTMRGAPCIQFGTGGITLSLNGHIMTGRGNETSCTFANGEDGIKTTGANGVTITGPGIVRRFNEFGILVGGNNSRVEEVTVLNSCSEGIFVEGSKNTITENSVGLSSLIAAGTQVGILVAGGSANALSKNEVTGGEFGGYGIVVQVPSNNNVITLNDTSGNLVVGIEILSGSSGNQILSNQALGNAVVDILDVNSVGTNTYSKDLCETSSVGPIFPGGTNICSLPHISGHMPPD